jgi:hypothetical protein
MNSNNLELKNENASQSGQKNIKMDEIIYVKFIDSFMDKRKSSGET